MKTAPVMDLCPRGLADLVEALRESHAIYSPRFNAANSVRGPRSTCTACCWRSRWKSIEPMVLALEGANGKAVRTMQWFISEGGWDDDALLTRHWQRLIPIWGKKMAS